MPWQLAQAKRPKRSEPRPIAECLPSINVNDLQIPRNYAIVSLPNVGLRYSQLAHMRLTYHSVEVAHCTGRTQHFKLKPIKTGFGYFRFAFICDKCQRPVLKLYFRYGSLGCRRCHNAIHASQTCDKYSRPALQARRLQAFLKLKPLLWHKTRQRLQRRYRSLVSKTKAARSTGQRINAKASLPHLNYQTSAHPLWR